MLSRFDGVTGGLWRRSIPSSYRSFALLGWWKAATLPVSHQRTNWQSHDDGQDLDPGRPTSQQRNDDDYGLRRRRWGRRRSKLCQLDATSIVNFMRFVFSTSSRNNICKPALYIDVMSASWYCNNKIVKKLCFFRIWILNSMRHMEKKLHYHSRVRWMWTIIPSWKINTCVWNNNYNVFQG